MNSFELWKDLETNKICFRGELDAGEIDSLNLDQFDWMVLDSPAESPADHLVTLELLFRRLYQQKKWEIQKRRFRNMATQE